MSHNSSSLYLYFPKLSAFIKTISSSKIPHLARRFYRDGIHPSWIDRKQVHGILSNCGYVELLLVPTCPRYCSPLDFQLDVRDDDSVLKRYHFFYFEIFTNFLKSLFSDLTIQNRISKTIDRIYFYYTSQFYLRHYKFFIQFIEI
jgi:hypothetical protein